MTQSTSIRRLVLLCAALAAAPLAVGAQAPAPERPGSRVRDAIGKRAGQPAPAPAPAAAPQGGTALDDRQQRVLGTIHTRHMNMDDASRLAAEKATSPEVKQLGQDLLAEIRRVDDEMKRIVAARGSNVDALPVEQAERTREQQQWASLRNLSGAEFDRQYVLALRELYGFYVNDLKRMRDETPGKDAELKGWLDQAENVAEERLTAIRRVKQSLDAQRAASR